MQKDQQKQSSKAKAKTEPGKTRQFHTRSRAGCIVCRRRHVRCDEARPSCNNCVTAKKSCEYTPARIPLRERRAQERQPLQPGEQRPWVCWENVSPSPSPSPSLTCSAVSPAPPSPSPWQAVSGCTAGDPFDTMMINMQYKSKELFHYFCQAGGYASQKQQDHVLRGLTSDPASLRNTLLLAGLHYAWNKGTLDSFESTFLYHKIESIRTVNQWLLDLDTTAKLCVRQIATLSFAEYCLGNEDAAEAHLQAVVAFLDMKDGEKRSRKSMDSEFVNRYLLISYYFLLGFKERAEDIPDEPYHLHRSAAEEAACLKSLQSQNGENRLRVLHLLPPFLSGPVELDGKSEVDAFMVIEGLREATTDCDQRQMEKLLSSPPTMQTERVTCAMRRHFMAMTCRVLSLADQVVVKTEGEGKETRMEGMKMAQQPVVLPPSPPDSSPSSSFYTAAPWQGPMVASLTGVGATAALFLHSVLENYNGGFPIDMRLQSAVLRILRQDLSSCERRILGREATAMDRDFWFWRVFVGAFSTAKAMEVALAATAMAADPASGAETQTRVDELQDLQFCFDGFVRRWGEATGTMDWRDAREALARTTWPEFEPSGTMAQRVWETATLTTTVGGEGWAAYSITTTGATEPSLTTSLEDAMGDPRAFLDGDLLAGLVDGDYEVLYD